MSRILIKTLNRSHKVIFTIISYLFRFHVMHYHEINHSSNYLDVIFLCRFLLQFLFSHLIGKESRASNFLQKISYKYLVIDVSKPSIRENSFPLLVMRSSNAPCIN